MEEDISECHHILRQKGDQRRNLLWRQNKPEKGEEKR
jgi:hypothetical protein